MHHANTTRARDRSTRRVTHSRQAAQAGIDPFSHLVRGAADTDSAPQDAAATENVAEATNADTPVNIWSPPHWDEYLQALEDARGRQDAAGGDARPVTAGQQRTLVRNLVPPHVRAALTFTAAWHLIGRIVRESKPTAGSTAASVPTPPVPPPPRSPAAPGHALDRPTTHLEVLAYLRFQQAYAGPADPVTPMDDATLGSLTRGRLLELWGERLRYYQHREAGLVRGCPPSPPPAVDELAVPPDADE